MKNFKWMVIASANLLLIMTYVNRGNIPWPFNQYIGDILFGIMVFFFLDLVLKQSINATLIVSIVLYVGMVFVQDMIPSTIVMYLCHGSFDIFHVGAFSLGGLISSLFAEKLVVKT